MTTSTTLSTTTRSTTTLSRTTRSTRMQSTGTASTDRWWEHLCGHLGFRDRRKVRRLGHDRVYEAGDAIVEQGARADRFVLIVDGEVEVLVGDRVVATLRDGDHFGEVAMLYTRPSGPDMAPVAMLRTATVRATCPTRVREFDRAETMLFLDAVPAAASQVSRRAVGRLGAIASGV